MATATRTRPTLDESLFDTDFLAGPDDDGEDGFGSLTSFEDSDEDIDDLMEDDDEDSGDAFGGDYEWYAGDEDPYDFDVIEAELDAELGEMYGYAGSLQIKPEFEAAVPAIAPALLIGVNLAWLQSQLGSLGRRQNVDQAFKKIEILAEWYQTMVTDDEDDAVEIAAYLTNEPGFGSGPVTAQMVESAIKQAAIPGLEAAWDEPLKAWWQNEESSWWDWITSAPSAALSSVKEYFSTDIGTWVKATLNEAGIADLGVEQHVNGLAIVYWLVSWNPLVGDTVYQHIANEINAEAGTSIYESQQVMTAEIPSSSPFVGPTDIAPPSSGSGLPEPQTILAFGYGAMTIAAMLGFK